MQHTAGLLIWIAVTDFAPIPPLIRHALEDVMRVDATEHPIIVTEPAWNTPANRERMAEIMFEEFQVPAFYIANTGVLSACVVACLLPEGVTSHLVMSDQVRGG